MVGEEVVGFCKRARAEEAGVRREGRRVGGLENKMFLVVNQRAFASGVATPENKDEGVFNVA